MSKPPPRRDETLGTEDANTLLGAGRTQDTLPSTPGAGLRHLAVVGVTLAALLALPYLAPGLFGRLRPWLPEDGVPIVRELASEEEPVPADVATGGASARANESRGLDEATSANLEEVEASPPAPAPAPEREAADPEAPPAVRIDPSELEGLVRRIENPGPLRPFYEALLRTARGDAGALTRVAHYGDSSIASDGITMTLRRRFQRRFGDGGHGFVLMARGTMPYRHRDVFMDSDGAWELRRIQRGELGSHLYGYGGVQYRGRPGARATFGTWSRGPVGNHVSRFELFFLEHPRGGEVELRLDRGDRQRISTRGEETVSARHVVEVPDGPHRLEVRLLGRGENRLFGVVLERAGPGVVYDSLGLVGARGRRLLSYDREHFREQHALRETDLIVMAFGGNDADDRRTPELFEEDYRGLVRLAREGRPEAGCLLLAPLDQAARNERGQIRTMPNIPIIVEAQERAALAEGCAFFNTWRAMGGYDSMRRWYRSRPRLGTGDFRHASPDGYRVIGNMLYKALLHGFQDFLEERSDA